MLLNTVIIVTLKTRFIMMLVNHTSRYYHYILLMSRMRQLCNVNRNTIYTATAASNISVQSSNSASSGEERIYIVQSSETIPSCVGRETDRFVCRTILDILTMQIYWLNEMWSSCQIIAHSTASPGRGELFSYFKADSNISPKAFSLRVTKCNTVLYIQIRGLSFINCWNIMSR